jgi:hypothetical protein
MTSTISKNDQKLLTSIAEHKVLTVSQLSALSQRSCQVVRRRMRALAMRDLIITEMHGYGRDRGRPVDLIRLTEKGAALLADEGIRLGYVACTADKAKDPHSIDHLLLVNWFRIHLLQIQRSGEQDPSLFSGSGHGHRDHRQHGQGSQRHPPEDLEIPGPIPKRQLQKMRTCV